MNRVRKQINATFANSLQWKETQPTKFHIQQNVKRAMNKHDVYHTERYINIKAQLILPIAFNK